VGLYYAAGRRIICAIAVGLLLLVSCASGTTVPQGSANPPLSSTGSTVDADLNLPLDWINVEYSRVSYEVGRAETLLAAACMRGAGFPVTTAGLFQVQPGPYTLDRRYGTYSPDVARTRGYKPEDSDPNDNRQLPVPESPAQRSAFLLALTGTADGLPHDFVNLVDPSGVQIGQVAAPHGCQAEAMTRLYGGLQQLAIYREDDLFIQTVASKAQAMAATDPAVLAVEQAWSDCMHKHGYEYRIPGDPQFADWPEPRPTTSETDTAVADMTCRQQVEYLRVLAAAEGRAQLELINADGATLNEILARRNAVVSNAEALGGATS